MTSAKLNSARVVLATPHARHNIVELALKNNGFNILRITRPTQLDASVLAEWRPDWVFFPHWSWKIPASIYSVYPCVVFHMTDLPFGRGGSPLQNLVVRGCSQTVLTALKCVENLDAGPIYLKKPLSLSGNADEILLRAANLMSEMISTIVAEHPEPQPQEGVPTYFVRRGPADGNIGELGDLGRIFDYIRMLDGDGYPPAFLETDCLRMEFSRARLKSDELFAHVRITRKKS